jgi:hypothetical protein
LIATTETCTPRSQNAPSVVPIRTTRSEPPLLVDFGAGSRRGELHEVRDRRPQDRVGESLSSEVIRRHHLRGAGAPQAPRTRFGFGARVDRDRRIRFARGQRDEDVDRLAARRRDDRTRPGDAGGFQEALVGRRREQRRMRSPLEARHDDRSSSIIT